MSATHTSGDVRRLRAREVDEAVRLLEHGMAPAEGADAALFNQHLLDALDQGEHERFLAWPSRGLETLLYLAPNASAIPAGDAAGAPALAAPLERSGWRVLIGDAPVARELLRSAPPPLFRRGPRIREQRFMVLRRPIGAQAPGLRPAGLRDLEAVTDFACRLHVEDLMGPAISRTGRASVRSRMMEAVSRSSVWVVERDGEPVAKLDLSLCSRRRGAQIAGVYVTKAWRGRGIASSAVAAVSRELLERGLPGVTLHVRTDNTAAVRAYERAGFEDLAPLLLALR